MENNQTLAEHWRNKYLKICADYVELLEQTRRKPNNIFQQPYDKQKPESLSIRGIAIPADVTKTYL